MSKQEERCPDCGKADKAWEGCARVECPKRKAPGLRTFDEVDAYYAGYEPVDGGYRKRTTSDLE